MTLFKRSSIALIAAVLTAAAAPAFAADMSLKAPAYSGYPQAKCGYYYGLGTGGSAGAVEGAVVGTQIVQGDLDALAGYTCPFGTSAFWFAEVSAGFANINGNVNGLALSGPLVFIERAGAGSPINQLFNPFGSNLALPSMPMLPAGVTPGAASSYFFAGMVEQDVGTQVATGKVHDWLIAPILGVGLLTRLNGNGSVIDTWAGWQMNTQSFCPTGPNTCGKLGNAARVGVSFKY